MTEKSSIILPEETPVWRMATRQSDGTYNEIRVYPHKRYSVRLEIIVTHRNRGDVTTSVEIEPHGLVKGLLLASGDEAK